MQARVFLCSHLQFGGEGTRLSPAVEDAYQQSCHKSYYDVKYLHLRNSFYQRKDSNLFPQNTFFLSKDYPLQLFSLFLQWQSHTYNEQRGIREAQAICRREEAFYAKKTRNGSNGKRNGNYILFAPLWMVFRKMPYRQLLFLSASDRWFPAPRGAGIGAGSVISGKGKQMET
jgi:hypothetical protein